MGFEQLADLRNQLAAKAREERKAKQERQGKQAQNARQERTDEPPQNAGQARADKQPQNARQARADKPSQKGGQARTDKRAQPRSAAKAKPSTPVDPVVLSIGKLQKRFPLAFPKNPAPKVPLKIGIWDDLAGEAQALGLSDDALREAIATWCRGYRYWACLVEGAVRVDLQGSEVGRVSQHDAARARKMRARRPAKSGEKATEQGAVVAVGTEKVETPVAAQAEKTETPVATQSEKPETPVATPSEKTETPVATQSAQNDPQVATPSTNDEPPVATPSDKTETPAAAAEKSE